MRTPLFQSLIHRSTTTHDSDDSSTVRCNSQIHNSPSIHNNLFNSILIHKLTTLSFGAPDPSTWYWILLLFAFFCSCNSSSASATAATGGWWDVSSEHRLARRPSAHGRFDKLNAIFDFWFLKYIKGDSVTYWINLTESNFDWKTILNF